jgi:hypothetical protein
VLLFSIVAIDHFQSFTIITAAHSSKKFSVRIFILFLQKWHIFAEKTQVLHHIKTGFFSSVSQILLAK